MPDATVFLTVIGRERPGIVAAITGVLLESDCDIRDSTMTQLAGQFAMLLVVNLPPELTSRALQRALAEVQQRFNLTVALRPLQADEAMAVRPNPERVWAITIYGGDQKGIVHAVASVLARKGITILDLKTRVITAIQGAGVVTMRVLAPSDVDKQEVREQISTVAGRFGIEVALG